MKIPKNKIALLVSILAVSALAVFCGILVMTSDSFTPNTKYSFTVLLLAIEAAVTKKKDYIYQAAMLDPHTAAELTIDQIVSMCDDLIEAHKGWLPEYH